MGRNVSRENATAVFLRPCDNKKTMMSDSAWPIKRPSIEEWWKESQKINASS